MPAYPPAFQALVEELASLPGVGSKTAQRLAFHLLKAGPERCASFSSAVASLHQKVRTCPRCSNLCEGELCGICADPSRDAGLLCVVEEPQDLAALERTGEYRGLYHLLLGSLSPLSGVGPEDLKVRSLLERLQQEKIREIILATNTDVEGEATALYLLRLIKPAGFKMTRLAMGLPMGGDLEYLDDVTLARALQGRREI
jgi:recombination protein RecR